jgi:hypothetical protein
MSDSPADLFTAVGAANAAMSQNIGWSITMNPTGGGHSAQGFGLPGPLDVKYEQGSRAMASAEVVLFGRPFVPVGRPVFMPIQPGPTSIPGTLPFGGGLWWTFGADGGAATFGWSLDAGGWQLVDEIFSPNRASIQIAGQPGASWLLTVQIISVLDTSGTVTLFADGVSKGTLADGDQVPVSGDIISLEIEVDFPTPAQDGFSIGYVLQPQ